MRDRELKRKHCGFNNDNPDGSIIRIRTMGIQMYNKQLSIPVKFPSP